MKRLSGRRLWILSAGWLMVTDTAPFRNPDYRRAGDAPEPLDSARLAPVTVGLREVVTRLAHATR